LRLFPPILFPGLDGVVHGCSSLLPFIAASCLAFQASFRLHDTHHTIPLAGGPAFEVPSRFIIIPMSFGHLDIFIFILAAYIVTHPYHELGVLDRVN
jgi:hypothetical protein